MTRGDHPRVTIVMTARERHAPTVAAIESIASNTAPPYRFIYLDVQSPDWLRALLKRRSGDWGLEVVRMDEPLWPQQARARIVGAVETDYVVFIDNDVQVEPGWLDALVACADDTGAGLVGPLYLWGDGTTPARIHMAGGRLGETEVEGGRVFDEAHRLMNADPEEVAGELFRGPCDFVEFHCMLIRTELVRDGTLLDPDIYCVHEHIDTALSARQRGYAVFLEPSSRVTYLAFSDYMLDDLALFRARWSRTHAEAGIEAFSRKWNVVNDDRSFGKVRQFLSTHVSQVDPVRPSAHADTDRSAPMRREELRQTRSDLLDFALERGYRLHELALVANAYHLAHVLMDGGYRPCGRPFINHLTGTASVLIRYGFRAETVAAGLLHSAYSHCPPHQEGPKAAADAVCSWLGGQGSMLEKRVRAYTRREALCSNLQSEPSRLSGLSLLDAEIIAITAANEVDMHLGGEYRYSGRTDAPAPQVMEAIAHVCRALGVGGLAETLILAQRQPAPVHSDFLTRMPFSYRIGQNKQHAVRMVSDAPSALP
jgi:GT2 family glycosyltransferase